MAAQRVREKAVETGRVPNFHFEEARTGAVIRKLREYGVRYGIEPVFTSDRSEGDVYEFHGWFCLSQTTEESDSGQLDAIIDELNELVVGLDFPTNVSAEVTVLNGEYYLLLHGVANRRRDEAVGMRNLSEGGPQ